MFDYVLLSLNYLFCSVSAKHDRFFTVQLGAGVPAARGALSAVTVTGNISQKKTEIIIWIYCTRSRLHDFFIYSV